MTIEYLNDIKTEGKYFLKSDPKRWIEIELTPEGFKVFGPIGRKMELMYMTVGKDVKSFKTIDAVINHLKRCAKQGFWQMREWMPIKPSYSEKVLSDEAVVDRVEGHYVYVNSPGRTDCIRLGWESPSDTKTGDKGSIVYVTTSNSGLIHFRRLK